MIIVNSCKPLTIITKWLEAVYYYQKALHLGCCSSPTSASDIDKIMADKIIITTIVMRAIKIPTKSPFIMVCLSGSDSETLFSHHEGA